MSTQDNPSTWGLLRPLRIDSAQGFYDVKAHKLNLIVEGVAPKGTTDIQLTRLRWLGALKFEVLGLPHGLVGVYEPYKVEKTIDDIVLPSKVNPRAVVLIVGDNYPSGISVDVHFIGGLDLSTNDNSTTNSNNDSAPSSGNIESSSQNIFDLLGQSFNITQPLDDPKLGHTIDVSYDPTYVKLLGARVQGSNIIWTFDGIKLGHTKVVVVVSNVQPPFTYIVNHDVLIGVLSGDDK